VTSLDVLAAGEIYVDLILSGFPSWPQPGQEAFARELRREAGGGAVITACGLAALGRRAGVFGVTGADERGWLTSRLEEAGVETSGIRVDDAEPTGLTVAVSSPKDRAFFTYAGANRRLPEALLGAAREGSLRRVRHVHLAFAPDWAMAPELFAAIRGNGCTISLDAGWHPGWLSDPRALELLPSIDLFLPSLAEAETMARETAPEKILRRFREAGLRRVALKLGARGAALLWDGAIHSEGPHQATARDTTGAGDAFDAGFLDAWLAGETPEVCLRAANICGALSTEAVGGLAGFPNRHRLRRILERERCEK
jgi:sugar/nucleoside kinase (ribokinase family)